MMTQVSKHSCATRGCKSRTLDHTQASSHFGDACVFLSSVTPALDDRDMYQVMLDDIDVDYDVDSD